MTSSFYSKELLIPAFWSSLRKLDPRWQWRNPVMFTVWLGSIATTIVTTVEPTLFHIQLTAWLWFTVLFANFAEAIAEGRGKAQAAELRKLREVQSARRVQGDVIDAVAAADLVKGDTIVCEAGEIIAADGEVILGIATVDESAITGESAPVIRESGGDRCAVTGGTRVLSDRIFIRVTSEPGQSFVDRMISLIEGARRQRTPNEIALSILLTSLTLVFVFAVGTLPSFVNFGERSVPVVNCDRDRLDHASDAVGARRPEAQITTETDRSLVDTSLPVLIALFVCLIPTTIGGLLSAIGISGIDRLVRRNVLATSGRAVEAAGDISVLLLDKTGTITLGNRMAVAFHPAPDVDEKTLAEAAQLSSLADETPEGRSVVVLAKERHGLRGRELHELDATFIPFTAQARMSGVDLGTRSLRKGAGEAIKAWVKSNGGAFPELVDQCTKSIAQSGGTPLVVADGAQVLGVIELKDVVKGGIRERFAQLRQMGIRTVMITGDNPLTAASIAAEAGVDDFMAEAKPEDKLRRIRDEQAKGQLVAMTGDGTNDAPALAQADVGVAMNTGTQAAREAGNMVDLDSNPTKLIEIVEIGKQLLMTRGALTTFSIANDVAKYFAILPAMFGGLYALSGDGPLKSFDLMHLHSPQSAILSAVIFNALIIIALIPLALKGVAYRAAGAAVVLRRNLLIYCLGGLLVPFVGIKLIDLLLTLTQLG